MNAPETNPELDDCNCCATVADPPRDNRPGLPALAYRAGTWATFLARLKAALPTQAITDGGNAGARPLASLTTRDGDDAANALLDAAAVTCDLLAFYNERILNEGYLRTATERRSVLELARAIGYELSPGVAASTWLAFTLEDPPATPTPIATPTEVALAAGTRAQSVPGQGQLPQIFETVEAITAKQAWNAMKPLGATRQNLQVTTTTQRQLQLLDPPGGAPRLAPSLHLAGTATNLKAGDLLLVRVGSANRLPATLDPTAAAATTGTVVVTVAAVTPDYGAGTTRVDLAVAASGSAPSFTLPEPTTLGVVETAPIEMTLDNVRDLIMGRLWDERDLAALLAVQRWDGAELLKRVTTILATQAPPADVFAFRAKAGLFGHAAPPYKQVKATVLDAGKSPIWTTDWDTPPASAWTGSDKTTYHQSSVGADLLLEQVTTGVARGSFVVLDHPTQGRSHYLVNKTIDTSVADFALSGKSTGLRLYKSTTDPDDLVSDEADDLLTNADKPADYTMRGTTVHLQSQLVGLSTIPIAEPVWDPATHGGATSLLLDRMVLGLAVGQRIAVAGTIADAGGASTGVTASEVATLLQVTHSRGYTTLTFAAPLAHPYVRSTLVLNGNVAAATHGETVSDEILGSGDGAATHQQLPIKKPPLTFVAAPTPSGGQSTLTVRVGGVAWTEVPSLYGLAADDRAYTLRTDDDGKTTVIFGDGRQGARPPTGQNNLVASYRSGLGPDGEVGAGTLTILQSRPLGLKAVTNPVAATGSAAPETLSTARANAPLKVRTLDRVVSLDDYGDFARAFAGIGKVRSALLWHGQRRVVHLTVASSTGGEVAAGSALQQSLQGAIAAAGDGLQPVVVQSFRPTFFKLDATLTVDPAYDLDAVVAAATTAVEEGFAFAARAFAQPVTAAEVIALLHATSGVVAVDLNYLHDATQPATLEGLVPAAPAGPVPGGTVVAAELLLLHPVGLALRGVNS